MSVRKRLTVGPVCVRLWTLWVTVPLSARTWNMTVIFVGGDAQKITGDDSCEHNESFFHINELHLVIDKIIRFFPLEYL